MLTAIAALENSRGRHAGRFLWQSRSSIRRRLRQSIHRRLICQSAARAFFSCLQSQESPEAASRFERSPSFHGRSHWLRPHLDERAAHPLCPKGSLRLTAGLFAFQGLTPQLAQRQHARLLKARSARRDRETKHRRIHMSRAGGRHQFGTPDFGPGRRIDHRLAGPV